MLACTALIVFVVGKRGDDAKLRRIEGVLHGTVAHDAGADLSTVGGYLDYLHAQSVRLDGSGNGITFVLKGEDALRRLDVFVPEGTNVDGSLRDVLNRFCLWSGLSCRMEPEGIVLSPKERILVTRSWVVPSSFEQDLGAALRELGNGNSVQSDVPPAGELSGERLVTMFKVLGIPFPDGSWITFDEGTLTLTMCNLLSDVDLAGDYVERYVSTGRFFKKDKTPDS